MQAARLRGLDASRRPMQRGPAASPIAPIINPRHDAAPTRPFGLGRIAVRAGRT